MEAYVFDPLLQEAAALTKAVSVRVAFFADCATLAAIHVGSERVNAVQRERRARAQELAGLEREIEGLRMEWAYRNRPENLARLLARSGLDAELRPIRPGQLRSPDATQGLP